MSEPTLIERIEAYLKDPLRVTKESHTNLLREAGQALRDETNDRLEKAERILCKSWRNKIKECERVQRQYERTDRVTFVSAKACAEAYSTCIRELEYVTHDL